MVFQSLRFVCALLGAIVWSSSPAATQVGLVLDDFAPRQGGGLRAGNSAPVPQWGKWLAGEAVPHGEGDIGVFAFYTTADGPTLSGDSAYLAELQRRFGDQPLAVTAVVGADVTAAPKSLSPCRLVVDAGSGTTGAWFGGRPGSDNVLVLDGDAQVTFRGRAGRGLIDAIERTLAGKPAIAVENQVRRMLSNIESNFDSIVGAAARKLIDPVLAHAPRDGYALALSYLTAATKLHDRELAASWRLSAVDRLANLSRPLAEFVDLALRGESRSKELAVQLAAAMVPATATAPEDPVVQLAYLRALVLSGKSRQVGRQAMTIRKLVFERAATAIAFCEILTQDSMPQVHRDLCEQAIARAAKLGAPPRQLAALRYVVAKRCAEDDEAATKILGEYLGGNTSPGSINNDCWYFMTKLPTMGRYDAFAAALADKMLESRRSMDGAELDTAALAMFLAGRIDEAVELQDAAIGQGNRNNPEYLERLSRYRAAAAAREGKDGGAGGR